MQITISPGSVQHTLADHSFGINQGDFFYNDLDNSFDRQLFAECGFEIFRAFTNTRATSYGLYTSARAFNEHMAGGGVLGDAFVAMLGTPIVPSPQPTNPATALNPAISTTSGVSLASHEALFEDWITDFPVRYWQFCNESHLLCQDMEFDSSWGGGSPFFDTSGQTRNINLPTLGERSLSDDWSTIRHREAKAHYDGVISAASHNCTVISNSQANIIAENGGFNRTKSFILGTMLSGFTNPNSPASNVGFLDILTVHTYRHFDHLGADITNQSHLNRVFWDSASSESDYTTNHPGKGGVIAPLRYLREILDNNGGSSVGIGIDESGSDFESYAAPLNNTAEAIAFCQKAGEFDLRYLITHAWTRTATTTSEEQFLLADETQGVFTSTADAEPGRRYYACKELWGKYMRLAKRQVAITINSAAGSTPAGAQSNSVPRIQCCAGLSASGTTLYLMFANVDLSTAEQLTVNIGTTTTGNITGVRCPSSQGATSLPTITPFGSGVSSFTTNSGGAPAVSAGDAFLLEIPIEEQEEETTQAWAMQHHVFGHGVW